MHDPRYPSPRRPRPLPHPPEVYRRRRLVAAAVVLLLVLALIVGIILGIVALLRGGDEPVPTASGSSASEQEDSGEQDGERDDASDGDDAGNEEVVEETTSEDLDAASDDLDDEPKVAEGPCKDESITVRATIDRSEYLVGDQPRFGIVVTNIGDSTCARDLGPAVQQVTVRAVEGDRRTWVNTDCAPVTGRDVWTLAPGDQVAFAITWSGTSSAPGCSGSRNPVAPGEYRVLAQVGEVESEPVQFAVIDPSVPEPEPEAALPSPLPPPPPAG
ncbi:hypothetical protein HT102_12510 [Hoyosella sp. G463]|uniref:DUF4232 domain-containing protein n=1 Tax=Lolliginicoccus lacisalsi TaxID=2742202 RepID=A0A927PN65_9ACTN|nr:hypothetical protein [Lolliginicoccus lacisalsi]MBD8507306.1 hypothetical protein [Lolliginicoccus lacisalsi]